MDACQLIRGPTISNRASMNGAASTTAHEITSQPGNRFDSWPPSA